MIMEIKYTQGWLCRTFAFVVIALGTIPDDRCFGQGQPDVRANAAEEFRQQLYKMSNSITAPEYVGREPEKDLELLEQFPAIRKLCDDAEKDYAKEIASDVQPYRNLVGTISYSRERLTKFEDAIKAYASVEAIREDAEAVLKSARQSVEYQAPAYFKPGSDIDRRTQSMKTRIKVLAALMPESKQLADAKELAKKTAEDVRAIQTKLLQGILEQNELPKDDYAKPDRKDLIKLVEDTWKKQAPKDKPILVGLIGSDWVRTGAWEIQNRTLYKIDRSRIQGFVVIPHDGKTVAVRHIQLQRDHTNQDKLTAWSLSDPNLPIEPTELVLQSKMKK